MAASTTVATNEPAAWVTVRLWFAGHLLASYVGHPVQVDRYRAAMQDMYPGLETTTDPPSAGSDDRAATAGSLPLPTDQLWPLTAV